MHLQYLKQRKPNDTVCIYLTHTGQNKEMLKIAREKVPDIPFIKCDMKKMDLGVIRCINLRVQCNKLQYNS